MITDRDIRIKKWFPRVLLQSKKVEDEVGSPIVHALGASATQFTHKEVNCSNVKTKVFTIGAPGVAGCDFNFTSAADTTEQVIDLGADVIPAFARIFGALTRTIEAFNPASTFAAETGLTSSGNELIASATVKALNAITQSAAASAPILATAADRHVYVAATPGSNWNTITTGILEVHITYIEV